MIEIPPLPPARGYETTGTAELFPRYEDITQDGRFLLTAFMPGLGAAVWRSLVKHTTTLSAFAAQGILPILRRLVAIGEEGPFSVHVPLASQGTWRLAREENGERIFLDMWLEAQAAHGSTLGPPPPKDTARVLAGRVYGEHVVTKPFAPKAERKVTKLNAPGLPEIPEDAHAFLEADALLAGHTLEDAGPIAFGMMHTDSNQHVNSLVYPRRFEEAVIQHLAPPPGFVARAFETRWRKPFFAGDRARIGIAVVARTETRLDVVGAFTPEGASQPSATIAMTLG